MMEEGGGVGGSNGVNHTHSSSSNHHHQNNNSSSEHKHKKHKKEHKKHKKHDRDRDRDRDREHKHKDRESSSSKKHSKSDQQQQATNGEQQKLSPQQQQQQQQIKVEVKNNDVDDFKRKRVEESSDENDDVPLSKRVVVAAAVVKEEAKYSISDSEDDVPLSARTTTTTPNNKKAPPTKKRKKNNDDDDDSDDSDDDYKKKKKRSSSSSSNNKKSKSNNNNSRSSSGSPTKRVKKEKKEDEEEVWKWWEEAPRADGVKWNFLEHKGPVFAPDYEPLPKSVNLRYDGKVVKLSRDAEEIAGFYSRFIEHEYTTKDKFNENFFKDWRRSMSKEERELIKDLRKCDFREINEYYKGKAEERKAMSKEEKNKIKDENERITNEYGVCTLDGHKEKIGNFRIEPPGLFRGRGDHPKMGMLKKRIYPEDVIINCSKDAKVPKAPHGRKWKEVRHDNSVTWLACWVENVQGQTKYVMLNPTSRLKGEKDWLKYEKARTLAQHIDKIRENYRADFKSKEMRVRQRAVALYFIDKLALRAGNEKDEDQADTVGCCSLRVEHIVLHDEKDGNESVVTFDFLGKDSIRYFNEVPVEKRVFKNLKIFMENKRPQDDLFDRLNTAILNKHLNELMDGLTAKVFRTYNASHTLQQQLDELTPKKGTIAEKVLAYNRANRAVAILCNHQRAVPKTHEKSMENLIAKIKQKKDEVKKCKKELKETRKGSAEWEKKSKQLERLEEQLKKLEMNKTDKEEGKEIALGTSKLNYLDPRISVAWCKKHEIPIEKVYNKTQRAKFRWAIDMAEKNYRFD